MSDDVSNPLDDPLVKIARDLEGIKAKVDSIDQKTERVVFVDTFTNEKARVDRELTLVRSEHDRLRAELERNDEKRKKLGYWVAGAILTLALRLLDIIPVLGQ